jgi:hypothetical protein
MPNSKPEFEYVSPTKLRFDPGNPRFYIHTRSGNKLSQEEIQALLEKEPHLALQLVDSFLENGFIDYEPLVVRREGGHYTVVEGNRRLAAIRHILANREKYVQLSSKIKDLENIPVLSFPESRSRKNIKEQRIYLGVRHLFGFRDWPAENKAAFLDSQIKNANDLQRTMKELNIKKTEIARYLIPYRLRKMAANLFERYKDQDFWILGEGLSRAGIKEYLQLDVDQGSLMVRGLNKKNLERLLVFIYGIPSAGGKRTSKRIKETRDLSMLARVLESPKARVVLEGGKTIAEASFFLGTHEESLLRLKQLIRELKMLLNDIIAKQGKAINPVLTQFNRLEEAIKKFLKNVKKTDL